MKRNILIVLAVFITGAILFNWHLSNQNEKKQARQKQTIDKMVKESVERNLKNFNKPTESSDPSEINKDSKEDIKKNTKDEASFLKDYRKLAKKFLMTQQEKKKRNDLLMDESLLRKSFLYLSKDEDGEPLDSRIVNSMEVIDYLEESMRWAENPNRASALQKTRYFLMNDILETTKNGSQLRVSATDKAELYLLLKKVDPAQAKEIKAMAKGSKLMAVINYAETNM